MRNKTGDGEELRRIGYGNRPLFFRKLPYEYSTPQRSGLVTLPLSKKNYVKFNGDRHEDIESLGRAISKFLSYSPEKQELIILKEYSREYIPRSYKKLKKQMKPYEKIIRKMTPEEIEEYRQKNIDFFSIEGTLRSAEKREKIYEKKIRQFERTLPFKYSARGIVKKLLELVKNNSDEFKRDVFIHFICFYVFYDFIKPHAIFLTCRYNFFSY